MKKIYLSLVFLVMLCLSACAQHAPMPTVDKVDLNRYMGKWHQIKYIPNFFQRKCAKNTEANYSLQEDYVQVVNTCQTSDGETITAKGRAHVVEDSQNSKLRVSFFRPFYGNYWILALGAEYQWVLVGEPGRKYGWILARTPTLSAENLEAALVQAEKLGYARASFRE